MAAPEPPALRPDDDIRPLSQWRILGPLSLFLVGFLLLVGLHGAFMHLERRLHQQIENEHARLFIGELLVDDIRRIESAVYRMATTLGSRAQQRVKENILTHIRTIERNLTILRDGGTAERRIAVNLESHAEIVQTAVYDPHLRNEQRYVLEVIDLSPKLDEIRGKLDELAALLERRAQSRASHDDPGLVELEREIKLFLKKLPPLFRRLTENANRMFYLSQQQVNEKEAAIAAKGRQYRMIEAIMVVTIVIAVLLLGLKFSRQIEDNNRLLANASRRMRVARDEAQRANQAKTDFVSRMSHELRTPLNAVLGFAQLLALEPGLKSDQQDCVREIDQAGNHLLSMINEILDLARVEAGRLELADAEYSMLEVADEALGLVMARAQDKDIDIRAFVAPATPARFRGDKTRVKQVLVNLLGNAVKFTNTGEVVLTITPQPAAGVLRVEVRDTGIGFTPETRARLFQPFNQADESISRQYGGTGLGLVIAKELVEAMGGRIDASSEPGEGSTFWFTLPLPAEPTPPALQPDSRFDGTQALIVTPDPHLRQTLDAYLSALGLATTLSPGGAGVAALCGQIRLNDTRCLLLVLDAGITARDAVDALSQPLPPIVIVRLLPRGQQPPADASTGLPEMRLPLPLTVQQLCATLHDARQAAQALPDTPPAAPTPSPPPNHGRVLLVEDLQANQRVATLLLNRLGLEAQCANNGADALDAIDQQSFRLILMDVQMPVMDGLEATRRIRQYETQQRRKHTPIIALTANAMDHDRDACLDAGMDDYLAKPIRLKELRELLQRRGIL